MIKLVEAQLSISHKRTVASIHSKLSMQLKREVAILIITSTLISQLQLRACSPTANN